MTTVEEPRRNYFSCFSCLSVQRVQPYDPTECGVCYRNIGHIRNKYYKCSHDEFCKLCLEQWEKKSNNCPICRAEPIKKIKMKKSNTN